MARFSKLQVLQTAADQGMVPLFYKKDVGVGKQILRACYNGGSRIVEFTNRGDFAHEVFGELSKFCAEELPELILGVGSVADTGTAALYMQLGANFIVTPSLREDVVRVCNRRKVPCMPGCASLTEIGKAEELGCDIVKLFPGSVYGANFIKSVTAPQPWTTIMPTGGVSPDPKNLKAWFSAGAYCVGMGSKLMLKKADGSFDFAGIKNLTRKTLNVIEELRK